MKIDYISDLHLDFWVTKLNDSPKGRNKIVDFIANLYPQDGDILIIAGDLGHYNSQIKTMLEIFKDMYKEVFVVSGNHDMYLVSGGQESKYQYDSLTRLSELENICKDIGVHYLDGQVVEIDGIKIGGTGMWYDLPTDDDINDWTQVMNDSKLIMNGYNRVHSAYSYGSTQRKVTFDTQKFFEIEKEKLKNLGECDILVSHIPCIKIPDSELNPLYVGDSNNKFYYADLIDLVNKTKCQVHIAGHTHNHYDFQIENFNMKINPLGYPSENTCTRIDQFVIKT